MPINWPPTHLLMPECLRCFFFHPCFDHIWINLRLYLSCFRNKLPMLNWQGVQTINIIKKNYRIKYKLIRGLITKSFFLGCGSFLSSFTPFEKAHVLKIENKPFLGFFFSVERKCSLSITRRKATIFWQDFLQNVVFVFGTGYTNTPKTKRGPRVHSVSHYFIFVPFGKEGLIILSIPW